MNSTSMVLNIVYWLCPLGSHTTNSRLLLCRRFTFLFYLKTYIQWKHLLWPQSFNPSCFLFFLTRRRWYLSRYILSDVSTQILLKTTKETFPKQRTTKLKNSSNRSLLKFRNECITSSWTCCHENASRKAIRDSRCCYCCWLHQTYTFWCWMLNEGNPPNPKYYSNPNPMIHFCCFLNIYEVYQIIQSKQL